VKSRKVGQGYEYVVSNMDGRIRTQARANELKFLSPPIDNESNDDDFHIDGLSDFSS